MKKFSKMVLVELGKELNQEEMKAIRGGVDLVCKRWQPTSNYSAISYTIGGLGTNFSLGWCDFWEAAGWYCTCETVSSYYGGYRYV